MWNRYREVADFAGRPYLLRFFDQIRFYEVPADELLRIRADFPLGRYPLKIEETELSLADYQTFLTRESAGIEQFRARQQAAFQAERERWRAAGTVEESFDAPVAEDAELAPLKDGEIAVDSEIAGSLWQVRVNSGDTVEAGDVLLVIESMKMEISVCAPCAGTVGEIHVAPGSAVRAGQRVAVIERL
jgi:urea carboxylase